MNDKRGWISCHPLDDKPVSATGKILAALPVRRRQPCFHEKVKTLHLRPQQDRLLVRRRDPLLQHRRVTTEVTDVTEDDVVGHRML